MPQHGQQQHGGPHQHHHHQHHHHDRHQPRSVLDDLGEEITGIVAPVSLCMLLVVVLVKALNPDGDADAGSSVVLATLAYHEQAGDSTGTKLGGALLNALIFMAVIAATTFLLFLLFKWGCYRLIYAYMGFAMANVFFVLTGALLLRLARLAGLHLDLPSLALVLFNFSVVGVLSLFFLPVPLLLKQGYTLWVGVAIAYVFTHVPEWTSWVLLGVMALYDLAAVLLPGGPLKILVELAIERQQELPALVYESRPTRQPYQRGMWRGRGRGQQQQQPPTDGGGAAAAALAPVAGGGGDDGSGGGFGGAAAVLLAAASRGGGGGGGSSGGDSSPSHRVALLAGHSRSSEDVQQELARTALLPAGAPGSAAQPSVARRVSRGSVPLGESREQQEQQPPPPAGDAGASASGPQLAAAVPAALLAPPQQLVLGAPDDSAGAGPGGPAGAAEAAANAEDDAASSSSLGLPDGIKLGLGDFIFYSMLVGRAAMYDMMTVYASFIAIIAGLGITLLLLALARKALPALPVSIALGVMFYFLTRLVIEPVMVPLSLNLAFY